MTLPSALLCTVLLALGVAPVAKADPADDRRTALQLLGRGTAAFEVGDVIGATRHWTEAIRLCRIAGASQLEAEALARRGEAYRVEGQFSQAREDLTGALDRARSAKNQPLIAAATGALGNLAFMSRRTAAAEPLLLESQALARRLNDAVVAGASSKRSWQSLRRNGASAAGCPGLCGGVPVRGGKRRLRLGGDGRDERRPACPCWV